MMLLETWSIACELLRGISLAGSGLELLATVGSLQVPAALEPRHLVIVVGVEEYEHLAYSRSNY